MANRLKEPHAIDPRKLPSGRWKGRVQYWDPDTGQRKETTQTFATEREAKKWSRETEQRFKTHTRPPTDETFAAFMARWLVHHTPQLRDTSAADYVIQAKKAVEVLGHKRLRDLGPLDFQELYTRLTEQELSSRSVRYVHAVCHRALRDAVDWDLIDRNPAEKAKPPKLNARVIHPLTPDESRVFQAVADTHPLKALWYILVFTGVRRGEALGLQWDDVLEDTQQLRICREIVKVEGRTSIHEYGKTDHSNRTIDCSEWLMGIVADHREQQHHARVQAGAAWEVTRPWVFTNEIGKFLRPDSVYHTFKQLLVKAELPSTTRIHDLRHGMATFWLSHGVPPQVVSQRLGHASIVITLQTYGHVLPTMQATAAKAMDALWRNPNQNPHQ